MIDPYAGEAYWLPCRCSSGRCDWEGDLHSSDDAVCPRCGAEAIVEDGPPYAWCHEQDLRNRE